MTLGYKKFLGSKKIAWFDPPRKDWVHGDIQIPINPELGFELNGTKHLIKLYLKSEKPSKDRFSSVLALMQATLKTKDCVYALLDVRNSKLYTYETTMSSLMPLVEAEAYSLEHLLK